MQYITPLPHEDKRNRESIRTLQTITKLYFFHMEINVLHRTLSSLKKLVQAKDWESNVTNVYFTLHLTTSVSSFCSYTDCTAPELLSVAVPLVSEVAPESKQVKARCNVLEKLNSRHLPISLFRYLSPSQKLPVRFSRRPSLLIRRSLLICPPDPSYVSLLFKFRTHKVVELSFFANRFKYLFLNVGF